MTTNSKRRHIPFNSTVYAGINKCNFLWSCAYELPYKKFKISDNELVVLYITDDRKLIRAVYIKDNIGLSGLLFESKTNRIVYGETMLEHRRQSIYKNLKAFLASQYKLRLWSDYQSADYMAAFNR